MTSGASTPDIRILGPLEVWVDGRRIDLGGGRQRALFALLAMRSGETVSYDVLAHEIWDGAPPESARKAMQNFVVQLRRALGPVGSEIIATSPPGYVLRVEDAAIDARRFEKQAAEGRRLLEHDPARAASLLREALALWRGDALADFAYAPFAAREIARLDEIRLGAIEDRVDADLANGQSAELVPELELLVAQHPLRERLVGALMLALYRSGRQADALTEYREWSTRLRDELGLEPGPRLRDLEQAILNQDPELGGARKLPSAPRRRRPSIALGLAGAVLGVAVVAAGIALRAGGSASPAVIPNSLVKIDTTTNRVVDVISVGRNPGDVAAVGEYILVSSEDDQTLTRVSLVSGETTSTGAGGADTGLARAGTRFVWVASRSRARVTRMSVESLSPLDAVRLPSDLVFAMVAVGGGSLWVSTYPTSDVMRYSLRTLRLQRRYDFSFGETPVEIAYGFGAAWVGLGSSNALLRIDARTGGTRTIRVGNAPSDPTVGFGAVWSAAAGEGTVWRINALTERPDAIIDVGNVPFGLAVGAGSMWVTNHCDGTVSRIDPDTNEVVATVEVGFFPKWIVYGGGAMWLGVGAEPFDSSRCTS